MTSSAVRTASRLEIVAARLWNVLNEGKTFTPVFVLSIVLLFNVLHFAESGFWLKLGAGLLTAFPLFLAFFRFDFPLHLRAFLWLYLAAFILIFGGFDPVLWAVCLGAYFFFTVIVWGSIYYHLRIGGPITNFTRFWRLVLENPDSTSGNFLAQAPKSLLLASLIQMVIANDLAWGRSATLFGFGETVVTVTFLAHFWLFNWRPALPLALTAARNEGKPLCRRFIAIVIDGCRRDRLEEARTPNIDRLRAEGAEFDMRTVYPARTVTCFSSMLTGAAPKKHGMRSNFVPSLGVKCDSIFDVLRGHGKLGKLVGIAHLVDAFGEEDVRTVTSVMKNEAVDSAMIARAWETIETEDPDFLALQLIRVDQTGHMRGSYNSEYLEAIEATDALIGQFVADLSARGLLEDATILITADHGQGRGIGGHGHLGPGESEVPCIFWGAGVEQLNDESPRSLVDIAPTIAYFLGVPPPAQSVGKVLLPVSARVERDAIAVIIPAKDEARSLGDVLKRVPTNINGLPIDLVVVDDGSFDDTAGIARRAGANVISHERNLGLGAALRTGLAWARDRGVRAAVYLDADGEYDPAQIPAILAPIFAGRADYVLGSRFKGATEGMSLSHRAGNHTLSAIVSFLAGRWISDAQTGFRGFSRAALDVAEIRHDYNYAQILTLNLVRKGMRLTEVPVTYERRRHGTSFIRIPEYIRRVVPAVIREVFSE